MHRQRINGFEGLQAAGLDPLDAAAAIPGREGHPQRAVAIGPRQGQGDADVAVHQPQPVVVAGDEHRAAGVPAFGGADQARLVQPAGDAPVEALDAPRTAAQGAQQLELAVGGEHLAGPGVDAGLIGAGGRAPVAHHLQVMAIALRAFLGTGNAVDHQAPQRGFAHLGQRQPGEVGVAVGQGPAHAVPAAGIDRRGELADAAVAAEAVAVAQHRHRLVDGPAGGVDELRADLLAGDARQPGHGVGAVVAVLGAPAQLAEHRAGLDRGELVLVAEQHQARAGRQRGQHGGHHLQVDHRRLVHHQHVHRQRVAGVVAEVAGVRTAAEQAVEGRHLDGDRRAHGLAVGQASQNQIGDGAGDGFVEPGGGLAGGRGQPDAQGAGRRTGDGQRLQHRQQTHHGGGLAGAGTAGHDRKRTPRGQRAGQLLPVGLGPPLSRREEHPEGGAQRVLGQGRRGRQAGVDAGPHRLFVLPVAAQIEPGADAHQRRVAGAVAHQRRVAQGLLPVGQAHAIEHLRRQRHGLGAVGGTLGRQRQGEAGVVQGVGQVEAGVAAAELVAGQRGGEDQQRRRGGLLPRQEGREGRVEGAQPAVPGPALEEGQQGRVVVEKGGVHAASGVVRRANRRSRASISARGGRSAWMPRLGAWLPRRKR